VNWIYESVRFPSVSKRLRPVKKLRGPSYAQMAPNGWCWFCNMPALSVLVERFPHPALATAVLFFAGLELPIRRVGSPVAGSRTAELHYSYDLPGAGKP
jgi:hypothetical protein